MKYSDMSHEQKLARGDEWVKVLDTYCPSIIIEDEDGEEEDYGKPCDQGALCDKCHYDFHLNLKYVKRLQELNLPLTDDELEKFKEYL